ncbi:MAG: hypothetical protein K0R38_613 [Polyangiaceae bacterium]|nr:hypothetical protein [Polyangiaceae bacterium]
MSFLSGRVLRMAISTGLVGMSLILGACGGGEAAPAATEGGQDDRIDFVLGPNTKQLSDADLAALQPGADTSQTLTFDASVGSKFSRGDVLLAGVSRNTPRGLLRVVTGTTQVGDLVEVETEQAPLQLAFQKLNVHVERKLDVPFELPRGLAPQGLGFPVGGTVPIQKFIFNGDGDPATLEDQLYIDDRYAGELGVTLDIDFDWGFAEAVTAGVDEFLECALAAATGGVFGDCPDLDMPVLSATFQAKALVSAEFDHAGAASAAYGTGKLDIGAKQQLDPIEIGPLVFLPRVGFEGQMKGRAGSYARMAGKSRAGFDVKVTASTSTGFDASAPSPMPTFEVSEVTAYLDGHVSTSVGPTLEMLAYGAIGPTFGLTFRSDLDVDRTRVADCYRASVALDANFGFVVRLPWREIGEFFSHSTEVGEQVEWVASKFGLAKTLVDESTPFELGSQQVGQGKCTIPPPDMLPPGAPQDDTLASPPFSQWSNRYDEPGLHFAYSGTPTRARTRLIPGVDGHLWAPSAPSPTLRRLSIDGRQLSATRYLAPIPEEDSREAPLVVVDVLERLDLVKWVLFENGTVARLGPDNALHDAFSIRVPVVDGEEANLRRGAVRADGRAALVYGVRDLFNAFDNRMVLVELNPDGTVLRSRSFGAATEAVLVQQEFFSNGQALYRADGSLLLGGESRASAAENTLCTAMSVADDGDIEFAHALSPGGGECNFGALAVSDNDDILLTGNSGKSYGNYAYTLVLTADGDPKASSGFTFGSSNLLNPLFVTRVSTSGYLVAGIESYDVLAGETSDAAFVVRLDAEGAALSTASHRAPYGVQLGQLDAYLSKDAGVVFAALADWKDQAEGRELTRFLSGKTFAKDGSLPFNANSGITTATPTAESVSVKLTEGPLPYEFADVPVTFVGNMPLRAEALRSPETVFSP